MKYELTEETKVVDGVTLHRIRAVTDFGDVRVGNASLAIWPDDMLRVSKVGRGW